MTHILWYQIPGLLQPLNGRGVEGGRDLEHAHKVVPLESVLRYLQPEGDEGTPLLGLVGGED